MAPDTSLYISSPTFSSIWLHFPFSVSRAIVMGVCEDVLLYVRSAACVYLVDRKLGQVEGEKMTIHQSPLTTAIKHTRRRPMPICFRRRNKDVSYPSPAITAVNTN